MDSMKKIIAFGAIIIVIFISGLYCGKYFFETSISYKQQNAYQLLAFKNADYYGFITLSLDEILKGNSEVLIAAFKAKQSELKEIIESDQNDPALAEYIKQLVKVPVNIADNPDLK